MNAPVEKSGMAQRVKPLGAVGIGILILGLNVVMLVKAERFYPFGTMLGLVLVFAGGFGVIVGEPKDVYGYQPTWYKVALAACAIVGIVAGLVLNSLLTSG
jgi:hypothetical protein